MKKIYTAAALIFAAFTGANAQLPQVDLAATAPVVEVGTDAQGQPALMVVENKVFPVTGTGITTNFVLTANTFDSIRARSATFVTGNGTILVNGDKIAVANPRMDVSAAEGLSFRVYTLSQDFEDTATSLLTVEPSLTKTDSIMSLMNIDSFENGVLRNYSNILVSRANLEVGKVYGWYSHTRAYPFDVADPASTYRDTIQGNNWAYTPIVWGQGVGIGGGFSTNYDKMDIYPNPANGRINYSADVKKASAFQTVRIMDLVGRNMVTENKGATAAGKVSGTLDISALAAGTYTIQVITEYGVSSTKFVKD